MATETTSSETVRPGWSFAMAWIGWILAVIFLAVGLWLAHHLAWERGQLDLAEGEASQLRQQLAHAEQIVSVMTAPDAAHIVLTENRQTEHPVGQVSWLENKGALVLIAGGLRALPANKTYELWLVPAGGKAPIPAGLFRPDAAHGATVVLPPVPAETQAKLFMVTEEPAQGSTTPSLPIVMEGQ
jgi:anti-sigma-K factor RskA